MKAFPLFALMASLVVAGCADNSPGGQAIHARREHFHAFGKAQKVIDEALKADSPDLAAIKGGAATIAGLAPQVPRWFPQGSGPQDGKRTDAKADIWTQPARFQQAATRLADAATALKAAADAGNIAQARSGAKALGAAGTGCHEEFKTD